ncbi:MAG: cellulase family glycosylhydrolase [Cyclobacteriaceae bacterium]|nr:cellulase family glycosylhydrolase [Cyclobacteriaceae bacterium]
MHTRLLQFMTVVSFLLILFSCNLSDIPKTDDGFIGTSGQRFVDSQGREVILHGINVVNKDPQTKYVGHVNAEDFTKFKSWGFNVVRLGIIWDGLEPEPGVYNEEYLKNIDQMIQWATDNGIYVFLDMHQDLFSVQFSDGAPRWATITDSLPHLTGEIWSDAYLMSPAVQTAFDHFWNNSPSPDGTGIQDHYITLWKMIAARYSQNSTVIGYDIMNEPFMGSEANNVMPLLLEGYAKMLVEKTGQTSPPAEELMMMWVSPTERLKVLETLSKRDVYQKVIDAIYDVNAAFESRVLTPFFQKARDVIREVDQKHIIFIEHSYFTNMGVTGALQPLVNSDGSRDSLVAYAAHGYDLVVDTDAIALGSNDRVALIFDRIAESGKRMNMPVLIGEWGAFGTKTPEVVPTAEFLMNEFNRNNFSDSYWAYGSHMDGAAYVDVLQKTYPVKTAGYLTGYNYNSTDGIFECTWEENKNIGGQTIIYVPDLYRIAIEELKVEPKAKDIRMEKIDNSNAGYLRIPTSGKNEIRKLTFQLSKN